MSTLDLQLPVRKVELNPPSLEEVAAAIVTGLQSNFEVAEVSVLQCPDLREPPYYLAAPGISGNPRIADVGDQSYLAPEPDRSRKYDLATVAKLMEMSPDAGALIGAGAGPFYVLGCNAELMPNFMYNGARDVNLTHFAKIREPNVPVCEKIGTSTGFALMANLFGSDGLPGLALNIRARSRIGKFNFIEVIQEAFKLKFKDKLISMGGVFLIKQGKANLHIMPDFPQKPFAGREDVEKWLEYFDFDAPLVCLSVFHSGADQGLDLRMEHTHCFSVDGSGRGGHYHYDLDETRSDIEYEAWFNVAEILYRIDQPPK